LLAVRAKVTRRNQAWQPAEDRPDPRDLPRTGAADPRRADRRARRADAGLVGKLDPGISGVRYASVFKYYGNAIEDGIDPLAFIGVTAVAVAIASLGAWIFERRDLSA
jgi:lysozyme family protein